MQVQVRIKNQSLSYWCIVSISFVITSMLIKRIEHPVSIAFQLLEGFYASEGTRDSTPIYIGYRDLNEQVWYVKRM